MCFFSCFVLSAFSFLTCPMALGAHFTGLLSLECISLYLCFLNAIISATKTGKGKGFISEIKSKIREKVHIFPDAGMIY